MYPPPERRQRVWRLRTRLLAPSLVVLLLGALVLLQIEELSAAWQAEALVSQRGASVLAGITKRIEERQHAKQIFAQLLADQGGLAEAVERRDPIGTAQLLVPLRTRLELGSIAVFNDDQSELLFAGHEEGRRLAARLRPTALTGLTPAAVLIEGDGLVVGAATPIKGDRGIVGAIVVAGVLNSGALREVTNRTSVDIVVVRAGTLVGTSATDPQVRDLITSWAETADLSELNNALRHLGLQASAQSIADDGVLVALIPIHDLVAAAEQRNWIAVAGVAGLVLLMLIIGIVLARDIARPLQSIITAADAIVQGDYTRRTEPTTIWELNHLASAFNNLAEQLGLQRARLDADLTRRKQAEAALARLNGELEQRIAERTAELGAAKDLAERDQATLGGVMASMTDGLIVLKASGEVRYCNNRAALLLDTEPDQLIGRALTSEVMASSEAFESPAAVMRDLTEALARVDEQPSIEMVMSQPQRRDLQVQLFAVPGRASGESNIGLLLHDVSAVRDLERTKDELVSVVSHELRTPLASVVGFTQLLLTRDFAEAERQEFLKVMETEGLRLTALINDFLDLQRIESNREQISLTPVAIGAVLQDALTAFEGDGCWPLSLEVPDDLPLILADSERIRQVVINLVGNARKYSPNGGAIAVSACAVAGNVEVSVQDHGLGLPATALPRLFEKFYRVDNSDRRAIKGTGLGLAISRKLIEAHGGRIWAESAGLGEGARFCFSVPAIAAEMGEGDVLIIEDDLAFARLLSVELERLGLSVVRTPSAETALAQVGRARPRAVSLDLGLPDVSGERLLPQLRQVVGPSTPVLVVTVKDLAAADERALMEHEVLAILRKGPATAGTAAVLIARALAPSRDFGPSAELLAS